MSNLPPEYWSFAFKTAVYLINRLPTPILNMKSPYQVLHKKSPTTSHLHSFGCLCFPWLRPYVSNKLQPRSQPCIFLGYAESEYSYLCLDPTNHKTYTSRHVKFFDHIFPYNQLVKSTPPPSLSIPNIPQSPHIIIPILQQPPLESHAMPHEEEDLLVSNTMSGNDTHPPTLVTIPIVTPNTSTGPTTETNQIITRSKNNTFKPKRMYTASKHPLPENLEPSNIREAMKHAHWRQAIADEFEALIRNGIFSLVPPKAGQNIVGCRWLFRIKRNSDGSIACYKARLVAKGFTQCPGINFKETFAPVVRPQTIKIILTLAISHQWSMRQLDVNNAFKAGLLLTGNNSTFLQSFIKALSQRFSLKNMGQPHYFLGIEIIPTSSGNFLSQHRYIRDLLQKFDMEGAKPSPTPLSSTAVLQLHDGTSSTDATEFRRIIGGLQYLNLTRPDLSYCINKLSQFMHKPTSLHLQHLKRILRYIKLTINHGLMLHKTAANNLLAYSDADWGGNNDDRTSTSAYIIFFGGNPISWLSRKQRTVARSSTEAEYRAVATATTEIMWLQNLLHELRIPIHDPPRLLCDNVGAIYLCSNPVLHSRMKYISLDYNFVREQVQTNKLIVTHVSTKDQLADLLTKPLPTTKFTELMSKIKVVDGTFILRGRNGPMKEII